jgi:hypothetical protein
MTSDLLGRAAAELRGPIDLDDLALAVEQAACLLAVLRLAAERHNLSPPHDVLAAMRGLRRWALTIKESQASRTVMEKPIRAG